LRRWYVIDWGSSSGPSRRLAEDVRDAVRKWLAGGAYQLDWVERVTVESTGEVVPRELWV
jgi:hypothetical protein